MKGPCKSLDVFDFREEDELPEVAARSMNSKFRNTRSLDHEYTFFNRVNRGAEINSKGICTIICEDVNGANLDLYRDATGSFNPSEVEDFAKENTPDLNCDRSDKFKTHEEPESGFPSVECSLSPGTTACLKDQINFNIPESSFNEEFSQVASDTDESKTSCDESSPNKCFGGWDLANDTVRVVFFPDYIDYRGTLFPDSVVCFSKSFVEIKSKTTRGIKGSFHLQLEIDDIIKIESQWSARYETGAMNICFIPKCVTLDSTVCSASDSGIHELKFPAVDSKWYEKQEAIESLDLRYKALWRVILDIGMDKCLILPDWKDSMLTRHYFPNFDKPFDEVIYPKGDPDAVSISKRDIDLLQPDTFVNDTIIDFYIKYLKNRQNAEERSRFHFFNSFFFRKLADMDKDPNSAFDGKAAFLRVRKWTRKVNLLEKDFIFIPVNYNYHWSLIVICYFGEVAGNTDRVDDKLVRVPCILHMDSLRGNHVGLKDLMQSYLWEEWKERQKETCEDHLCSNFKNLKFISPELPQQQNLYDCGLFLLHYVELFLEDVPANFSIHSITASSNFLQADWFPPGEASMKRAHIERLIYELLETHFEDCSPSSGSDTVCSPNDLKTPTAYENVQGIEMTLLPVSSTSSTKNLGLIVKDLFEPGCASGLYNDVHSLGEMKKHLPLTEERVEVSERFAELAKPVFQHEVGLTPYTPLFSHISEFRFEPESHAVLADADSSPASATSGNDTEDASGVEEADEKCRSFEDVGSDDEPENPRCMIPENIECSSILASDSGELPEFYRETNQMQEKGTSSHELLPNCSSFAPGEPLDVTPQGSPDRAINSIGIADPCSLDSKDLTIPPSYEGNDMLAADVDSMPLSESHGLRAAKRMRLANLDEDGELTGNLSDGLHL